MNTAETVAALAKPIVEGLGLELIDCEYKKEGDRKVLRIYIDKRGGVGLDDCEAVSRNVEEVLDREDLIEEAYTFEVSSPGIDRPLKTEADFARYEGADVEVSLYAAKDGRKKYKGKLAGYADGELSVETDTGTVSFRLNEISKVKRIIIW